MKKVFKKIAAVGASVLMAGFTAGIAAAASFPAPFVQDGVADVAIVYGTGEGVSSVDAAQAANIQTTLGESMPSDGSTVISGDSYKFEKTSTKFHLGDTITGVISSDLDDDQLPGLLADGTYIDDDNDEFDYTQKITMAASQLTMFDDNDYAQDAPTVGFKFAANADVLTYTLEFSEEPLIADLPTTTMRILGKDYYVLAATSTKLTLLDSAEDTILAEGETQTINVDGNTYTVSIGFISDTEVKLTVNGENTNSLGETETYKLSDGTYLGVKDILYTAKDTGVSKVEFSIGKGKLVLENGQEIKMNEDTLYGMTSTLTNSTSGTKMTSLAIDWNTEDEVFLTEDSSVTMPGFEAVSLAFDGLHYPAEEAIEVANDGTESIVLKSFPLKDGPADINLLYTGGADYYAGLGKDSSSKLVTGATSITFDGDDTDYFVASWTDGRDAESYLMRATNFKIDNDVNKTTFQYYKDGSWVDAKTDRKSGDTFSIGNVELEVGEINKIEKTVVVTNNSAATNFNTLYSEEGLKIDLPSTTSTDDGYINITANPTAWNLTFHEEDKDGDVAQGDSFEVTLGLNSQSPKETSVTDVVGEEVTFAEIGSTDVYRSFMYSALATEFLWDKGGDQDTIKVMYHGDEVAAGVYIASPDSISSSSSNALGDVLVTDAEVASVSDKNLIVVGGSAINSVAAHLLGGDYRGPAFTEATGVGAGQFLIQSFGDAYTEGKIALLVAGYNVDDTANAATYLRTQDVDTTAGNKYIGTSATEATLQVA